MVCNCPGKGSLADGNSTSPLTAIVLNKPIIEQDIRPKTIICDIDGTLIKHDGLYSCVTLYDAEEQEYNSTLPGVLKKFEEWEIKGYKIILLTGRKESMRANTESYLTSIGIFWDQLVMGVGGGPRYLINDRKPDGRETAFAINIERDKGLQDINI